MPILFVHNFEDLNSKVLKDYEEITDLRLGTLYDKNRKLFNALNPVAMLPLPDSNLLNTPYPRPTLFKK